MDLETLRRRYYYNPNTGFWYNRRNMQRIGHVRKGETYECVYVLGKSCRSARLAVFYMTGEWLGEHQEVDHVDWDTLNNAWDNIRVVTHAANQEHRDPKRNKTGYRGVSLKRRIRYRKDGSRYETRGYVAYRYRRYLGHFRTIEEAAQAYDDAEAWNA